MFVVLDVLPKILCNFATMWYHLVVDLHTQLCSVFICPISYNTEPKQLTELGTTHN